MKLGRVLDSGPYGKRVELIDDNGTVYQNAHLENFGDIGKYQPGDTIPKGTWIGSVGDSGNAKGTPTHSHFEARPQSDGNFADGKGPQSQTNPELIDPKTEKPYADAFSMGRPDAGSLHTDRGGITGDPKYDKTGDDRAVAQPDESRNENDPTKKPGENPPEGVKQPVKQGSQRRPAGRVHRLTDRNSAGGVIDLCVAKTVFVDNLPISTDGSQGTEHPPCDDDDDENDTNHCYHYWFTDNGSKSVFVENRPVNFEGNADTCGHVRIEGSPDVFVGDSGAEGRRGIASPPVRALGYDSPARNYKEANRGGNASPSNIRCRQKGLDDLKKKADPNDPNANGPQWTADPDDPNKPTGSNPGVPAGIIPTDGQTSRDRLIQQMDQDYSNRDQWNGGKSSPAGQAAFSNLGFGGMPNGTAWCAVYVNSNLKDSGAGYAPSMAAASPKCFKQVQPSQAKPGDILVFSGHTALVREVKSNGNIVLQGGNQGGGAGAVTRNTISASNGYNYGGQGLVGVYDPHDKNWNDANVSRDCKPGGSPADPNNTRPSAPINGSDCPAETVGEKAAAEGKGIKTDQDGVDPGPDSGRPPDSTFGGSSSILAGVSIGGTGGTTPGGITGSILGGMGQSGFGAGAGRGFINPPLVDPTKGPYNAPAQVDSIKQAAAAFDSAMTSDPGPAISPMSTCDRALELAREATGKQYPSGTEVAAQLANAQKLWWNETTAANNHRYTKLVAAYKQAGINIYRPMKAETMTRMMAYQSGWGDSKCVKNSAYNKNNPIGVGWDGNSWYEYPSKAAGYTAMWGFLTLGTDGSLGRYMLPQNLEDTVSAEVDYIYKQGLTDGTVPPAVMLIKDPNTI